MRLLSRAAMLLAAPVLLHAQAWTAFNTSQLSTSTWNTNPGTRAFWNNGGNDGATCNIGFVVTQTNGTCFNQRPNGWLNYTGFQPNYYLGRGTGGYSPVAFLFDPGTYYFRQGIGIGGDLAGADQGWSFFELNNNNNTTGSFVTYPLINGEPNGYQRTFTRRWGILIDMFQLGNNANNPGYVYSNSSTYARQFALFSEFATPTLTTVGGVTVVGNVSNNRFFLGLEDVGCAGSVCPAGADFDNNDMMISFNMVVLPEPATVMLTGAGLAMIGVVARRRKKLR
jgi:hypothetical protein